MNNKITKAIFFAIVSCTFFFTQCGQKNSDNVNMESKKTQANGFEFKASDTTWKSLSLREKIGQTMMVVSEYYNHLAVGSGDIKTFMEKYPVGGLFIAKWYYRSNGPTEIPIEQRILASMQDYESASRFPMFFCEDFERGLGETYNQYTHLPVEMSLGAANDPQLAYDFGKSIAMESKEIGINWLLHPVADLNIHPLQDLVIERAISDNPHLALPLLKRQIDGIQEQKVISTIKHFPGDGTTIRNQHLITSANIMSMDDWHKSFGMLFQNLINHGAASIMVGHITLPAYQKEMINGMLPPATLSKEIMIDLLKNEMDFKGAIISDALNMGGSAGYYPDLAETSVQSFVAGVDMMLWPSLSYMDTLEARILRGEIPMERLDDAVERIWALREHFGLLEKKETIFAKMSDEQKEEVKKTGTKLGEKALTLLEDRFNELPLNPEKSKRILLSTISYRDKSALFETTKKELEARGFEVTMLSNPHFYDWGWRIDSLNKYDKIIVCFENKYFDPLGSPLLKEHEAFAIWTINMTEPKKRIVASFSNPYYPNLYSYKAPIRINAYSSDNFTQKAFVKALCGEIPFQGKSPVNLDQEIVNLPY
jgi:beta-N-acetylhexosaminidase